MDPISPVLMISPGVWRVAASRVSLESVVVAFRNGESVRTIVESYPSLSEEQIESALTWYQSHRTTVDEALERNSLARETLRKECQLRNAELHSSIRMRLGTEAVPSATTPRL